MNCKQDYYKAYEDRYYKIHKYDMLWSSQERTTEIKEVIDKYNISLDDKILELGCGEGRDAFYLLNQGYDVLAVDYSNSAIEKCRSLSNHKFDNRFRQLDIIKDLLDEKFKFIYSIAVLHMFVLDEHRDVFLSFIREHLDKDGIAFICVLGDGKKEFASNVENAFEEVEREVLNNGFKVKVATTSCKIVDWSTLEKEVSRNNLRIEKKWISEKVPEFNPAMCLIVSLNE